MKRKSKITKFLTFVGIVAVIALLLMIPFVSDKIGSLINKSGSKIREVAQTIVGTCVAVFLITIGVSALSIPILAGALIVVGIAMLWYSLSPLFLKRESMNTKITGPDSLVK